MPSTSEVIIQTLELHEILDILLSDYVISSRLICGQSVLCRKNLLHNNQKYLL